MTSGERIHPMTGLAGLVLCGGSSRRMGRDKASLPVAGRPLVLVVAERLSLVARPVLLAPGRPGRLGRVPYGEVADAMPRAGPLGGLVAGLEASPHALMAVAAVDMPFASPSLFRLLARLRGDEDAVVPLTERGPEPLHAVYASAAAPALRAAIRQGRRSVIQALSRLRVREVPPEEWRKADPGGRFATNLNLAEDVPLRLTATDPRMA